MKDYGKILQYSGKAMIQKRKLLRDSELRNGQWDAIQAMEEIGLQLIKRMEDTMAADAYIQTITSVDMQIQSQAKGNEEILLKAQLYLMHKKQYQVKVYAHTIGHNGKTKRLAWACYHLSIEPDLSRSPEISL